MKAFFYKMNQKTTLKVPDQDINLRLDRFLLQKSPQLMRSQVFKLLRTGAIRVNDLKSKPDYRLQRGDIVTLPNFEMSSTPVQAPKMIYNEKSQQLLKSLLIANEADFVILNKPYGLATQSGTEVKKSVDELLPLFDRYLGLTNDNQSEKFCRLVHRLDRDTSGVLVIAKRRSAATWLGQAFKQGHVLKTYVACVWGRVEKQKGMIKLPLIVNERKLEAETEYEVLNRGRLDQKEVTLLKLMPRTGRKHQLRRHCHLKGYPIIGDQKYDIPTFRTMNKKYALQLHAWRINFQDEGENVYTFEAPLPPHMLLIFDRLGWRLP